jgi:uncharacterized protein
MDVVEGDFIWNVHKEKVNILKHRIDFSMAAASFLDPWRIISNDDKHAHQEDRFFCIGKVDTRVITVRFTHRNDKIRIIGAGYWRKGKEYYEDRKNDKKA